MDGFYQADWDCKKYCHSDAHWADCPKNPVNIKRYGNPQGYSQNDDEDERGNPINV